VATMWEVMKVAAASDAVGMPPAIPAAKKIISRQANGNEWRMAHKLRITICAKARVMHGFRCASFSVSGASFERRADCPRDAPDDLIAQPVGIVVRRGQRAVEIGCSPEARGDWTFPKGKLG